MPNKNKLWTRILNRLDGISYKRHSEAIIIACYFNPQGNPYRKKAFDLWYNSIKHLNHRIIELTVHGSEPELPETEYIHRLDAASYLWHKESLLNILIKQLPKQFKYIFWLDTDVMFSNPNWLVESVEMMCSGGMALVQPFEYCKHLERDEPVHYPSEDEIDARVSKQMSLLRKGIQPESQITEWYSFCAMHRAQLSSHENYDLHGHVGFAWGARREVLEEVPLYDKALIGGADHIIAHAGAGHFAHSCIKKAFSENLEDIDVWSRKFYEVVKGRLNYAPGILVHIWHGDIKKREYLKRIQDFDKSIKGIKKRDQHGLYILEEEGNTYFDDYMESREGIEEDESDDSFLQDISIVVSDNSFTQINPAQAEGRIDRGESNNIVIDHIIKNYSDDIIITIGDSTSHYYSGSTFS